MQAEMQKNTEPYNDDDVLDLGELFWDYVRCVKKYWMQFLLLTILVTAVTVTYQNWSYEPTYVAKITYAVKKTEDTNVNAYMAKSLSSAVPVITAAEDFKTELLKGVKQESINNNYSITSSFTEKANLFSVSVASNNYKNANIVLDEMEKLYPVWASKSNGTLELQTVDKSEASETPVNPYSLVKSILTGLVLGLAICFGFATWYALTIKTVRKESDMRKITGQTCISLIPEVKLKKRAKSTKEQLLISNKRIDWGFKQSVLATQSRIEKLMIQKKYKVLMVTSTLPQEGKSTLAVNLALAFSKHQNKVLIIDCDMRNPHVGRLFGLEENTVGLSDFDEDEFLTEIISLKDGVDIICAGSKRRDGIGNIPEVKLQNMMTGLRRAYDYIIIDTPPAHLFTDAAILEKYADCVLYVVRHDMAEVKEIKDGIAPFIRTGKLLGYTINRNPGGFSSYGKYGYSKYGHYRKYERYMNMDESSLNTEDSL